MVWMKKGKEKYKPFHPAVVCCNFQLGPCAPLRCNFFRGPFDGVFISSNVVTLKGWIAFVKRNELRIFTHVAQTQRALKRTPGSAAGGKSKVIVPTVLIISIWLLPWSLTPRLLLQTTLIWRHTKIWFEHRYRCSR